MDFLASMFAIRPFAVFLAEFVEAYPKIEMRLYFSDQQFELIRSEFDVAIRRGQLDRSQYRVRRIFQTDDTIVASPDYMKAKPPIKYLADLEQFDWIRFRQIPINK